MTYEEAREFIEQSNQYGSKLGLESVTELLSRLGNPQDKVKVIHVAGTNGKGSTTAYITSILATEGYKVGRYISPAVFNYRERIQISKREPGKITYNTEYISKQGVSDAISVIKTVCNAMVKDGWYHPTTFELETAMAFLYFSWQEVDFAVVEVGLGGRLDATNVMMKPVCCVITSISMDHMQFLGDTLDSIAREKAGIIRASVPIITCNKKPEIIQVLSEEAELKSAPIFLVDADEARMIKFTPGETIFEYHGQEYEIALLGMHQITNAILALSVIEVLLQQGHRVNRLSILDGLRSTEWSGRFEIIAKNPLVIIDGAHNEDAALRLAETVRAYFADRRVIYIMGVFADKDYRRILELTAPLADTIITLTPNNSRALSSADLALVAQKYCPAVFDAKTTEQAVCMAYEMSKEEDVIIAFGSLSFLGELKKWVIISRDLDSED
jgi:dihydrofolate synthase/folylpolyglutamate synthase